MRIILIASYLRSYNNNLTHLVQTNYYMYVVTTYQQDKPTAYPIYYLYVAPTYQQDKPTTYTIYYLYIAPTYQLDKSTTYITIKDYINPSTIYIIKNFIISRNQFLANHIEYGSVEKVKQNPLITKKQSHQVLLTIDVFVMSYRLSCSSFDVYFGSLSYLCCFAGLS
jgi:hypothetical protein